MSEMAESLQEDRSILIDLLNKLETQNVERDLAMRDYERRVEREDAIMKMLQESGMPMLMGLANSFAENQEEARAKRKRERELASKRWPPGYAEVAQASGQPLGRNGGAKQAPFTTVKSPGGPPADGSSSSSTSDATSPRAAPDAAPSPRARRDAPSETAATPRNPGPQVVQAEGFATGTDQMGAVQTPGNEPPPATPARGCTEPSPSGTLEPDVPDVQSPDRADPAGRKTATGVEADSAGGRPRGRQRRAAGGGRKSTKRRTKRGT
jgi:hypothetical protein